MSGEHWDVFMSYGHADAEWVGVLAANLHRDGFKVFLDEWELVGGDRVTGRLEDAIRDSQNGVLVVSPYALSRPWVRQEYEALLRQAVEDPERRRRLIPVLYRDAELPAFMANHVWVDFRAATTGPRYDAALERLQRYLSGRAAVDRPERGGMRVWPADGVGEVVRPAGAMRLSLVITGDRVSLCEGAAELAAQRLGLQRATLAAVRELLRLWRRGPLPGDTHRSGIGLDEALADVGRRLSRDVLCGEVGAAVAKRVADAVALNEVLELGLQTPELGDLPWETLPLPDIAAIAGGASGALALHRNVAVFREVAGLGAVAAYKVRGPLRILAVIASPECQHEAGELLNYEAELARIVAAVDPARRLGHAHVRVLAEGSLAAIRAALEAEPEGFHVLHLSCHARPGELLLEIAEGGEDAVSARRLLHEGLPAGVDLPMVVLSGCSTGLAARQDRAGDSAGDEAGETALAGMAEQLLEAGVPVVLAMQAPVSDVYATDLAGQLYEHLATAAASDPLAAISQARRAVEQARQKLPADAPRRARAEWAIPALWARGPRLPLFNRHEPPGPVAAVTAPVLAEGIVVRKVGEFVGRRQELRVARRALDDTKAGLVVHAIGGVGKSTFAAELITTAGAQQGAVMSLRGALSVDRVLDEVGARLTTLLPTDQQTLRIAAQQLRVSDVEWADRWRVLVEIILPAVPMIVLLDDFEDNLTRDHARWSVRDPELADLLARWMHRPGQSKLLITSRHPFELPGGVHRRLERLHLGPLSVAETAKLVWQLPGLDALSRQDRERAYRSVGGHPRTLEYLDALLRGGYARFDDVAQRMEQRLSQRGIQDPSAWMASMDSDLDSTLAEAVTLAVDDIVLGDLLDVIAQIPLARELVIGASVYRVPVDEAALVWQLTGDSEPSLDFAPQERMTSMQTKIEHALKGAALAPELTPADLGVSDEGLPTYHTGMQAEQQPPVPAPDSFAQVLAATLAAGLIAPITRSGGTVLHLVHRWTAQAIEQLEPDRVAEAHHHAARYWRRRVQCLSQSQSEQVEQLIEGRYHHHAAGEHDAALELSEAVIGQLRTWGQYGRASELCRETLGWLPSDGAIAAVYIQRLGRLAHARGDYDGAEQRFTQAVQIQERLDDQPALADTYHNMGVLAQARGDYDGAEQRYTQALQIRERLGDQAGLAHSYQALGAFAHARGDYDGAEQHCTRALQIRERLGDHAGLAETYHNMGVLAQARGDYDGAEQRYEQALQISERLGYQAGIANSYRTFGGLAKVRGDYEATEQRFTQALQISERLGDQAGLAKSYQDLGVLAQARGDYDGAEQRFTRALQIRERLGDQASIASNYHNLGTLAHARGDYDGAEQRFTRALQISERLGDQAGLANSYENLGVLAQAQGDYDGAEQRFTRALHIRERLGDQAALTSSYQNLGALAQARDDYDGAEQRFTRALHIRERLGDQPGLAQSYHSLGTLAHARRDYDGAEQRYTQALHIQERLGDLAGLAGSYHNMGVLAQDRGDYDGAAQRYTQALQIQERLGDQPGLAYSYQWLGAFAHERGDYDGAEQRYTQALQIQERLGDQPALANSCAVMSELMATRGDHDRSVHYDLRAFNILVQMRDSRADAILERLAWLRNKLGRAAFARIAAQLLDEASLQALTVLLNRNEPMQGEGPRRRMWRRRRGR